MQQPAGRRSQAAVWALVLALTALTGLVWWGLLPPWAAPDEPGHFLYSRQLAGQPVDQSALEERIIGSLARSDWWRYNGRQEPATPPARFASDPVLAASGDQTAGEPPLYYLLPALWLSQTDAEAGGDPAAQLRVLRLQSWGLHLLATAAALLLAGVVWPGRADRALGLGLLVGLWPMAGFVGAAFNNDALALCGGAILFTLIVKAWLRGRPGSWLAALLAVGAGPLVVDINLLYLWPLTGLLLSLRLLRRRPALWPAFAIAAAALLVLFLPHPRWAAGWRSSAVTERSRDQGVLALAPAGTATGAAITQILGGKDVLSLRGLPLTVEASVSGRPGSQAALTIADQAHALQLVCRAAAGCSAVFTPDPAATFVRVEAASDDDVRLQMALRSPSGRDLLFNGSGRQPDLTGRPLFRQLERWLPVPAGFFARMGWAAAWDTPSQFRYMLFTLFMGAGFWGYFGWLSRPLPILLYPLLALLTLAAAAGLVMGLPPRLRRLRAGAPDREDQALLISALALALILLQTWLPMVGQAWQPQGRYLLPALAPVAVLLLLGWEAAWPVRRRRFFLPVLGGGLLALNLASWWVILP